MYAEKIGDNIKKNAAGKSVPKVMRVCVGQRLLELKSSAPIGLTARTLAGLVELGVQGHFIGFTAKSA